MKVWMCVGLWLACAAPTFSQSLSLRGTIVTPSDVIADGVISLNGTTITSVMTAGSQPSSNALTVDGVIFPGLIDLHNHLTWNALPRWTPLHLFADRYEWQESKEYADALSTPHGQLVRAGYDCDLNRYAELKAIVNGATATVGSINNPCIRGLARNLDFLTELTLNEPLGAEPFRNDIFPFEIHSACGEQAVRDTGATLEPCALSSGESPPKVPRTVVAHLGEGVDAAARREFTMFTAHGYLRPGVSIIHGVGLRPEHFQQMAAHGVGLIWSPRSNIELYGTTTNAAAAKSAGVVLAVAPDWSPSGSTGMLAELAYIDAMRTTHPSIVQFTNKELVEMATTNPARLAHLNDHLGKLAPGYAADLILMRKPVGDDVYAALVKQTPADLRLVVIGGTPVFGEPALMKRLLPTASLEAITICGQPFAINVQVGTYSQTPWATTESRLQTALKPHGLTLAPFVECMP